MNICAHPTLTNYMTFLVTYCDPTPVLYVLATLSDRCLAGYSSRAWHNVRQCSGSRTIGGERDLEHLTIDERAPDNPLGQFSLAKLLHLNP